MILTLLSQGLVFLTPIVLLPLVMIVDYELTLKLSIIFCTYHLLVGLLRLATSDKLESVSWLLEVPLFIGWTSALYYFLPNSFGSIFETLLRYSGPILLIIESIQFVRLVMYMSHRLVNKMYDNSNLEPIIKGGIIFVSLLCYVGVVFMVYFLFQNPAINIPLASYLSVLCTLLATLCLILFFVEAAIFSEVALISLFVIFVARTAFLEASVDIIPSQISSWSLYSAVNFISETFNLGKVEINLRQFLTLDFLISTVLAVSTMLSFPLSLDFAEDPFSKVSSILKKSLKFNVL